MPPLISAGFEVLEAGEPDHFEFHLHHQIDDARIELAVSR
jgi:hypothetical protein